MIRHALIIILIIFSFAKSQIYFYERDFLDNKIYINRISNEKITNYEIPAIDIYSYSFLNDDEIILNFLDNCGQKLSKLNLTDKSIQKIYKSNNGYIVSFINYLNKLFLVKCKNEILRLEEDELFSFDLTNKEENQINIGEQINFNYLDISVNGKYLSFLYVVDQDKDGVNFDQYIAVYNFHGSLSLVDSIKNVVWVNKFISGRRTKFTQWINDQEILYSRYDEKYPNGKIFKYNLKSGIRTDCNVNISDKIKDFYYFNQSYYIITANNNIIKYNNGVVDHIYNSEKNKRKDLDYIIVK